MTTVVITAIALVLCTAVAGALIGRRKKVPAAKTDSIYVPVVPTFKVVALGLRGSGKTVYLASMYDEMMVAAEGRSYYLKADFADAKTLSKWKSEIVDPNRGFPPGTSANQLRKFTFGVRARSRGGAPHTIMNLEYVDYAGGLLSDPDDPGATAPGELWDYVESAHALVVVVDGERLAQHIAGDQEGTVYLEEALRLLTARVLELPQPINFVITKWDLLQDLEDTKAESLRTVRRVLQESPKFRALVQLQSARRIVRLVPVSAFGAGFLDVENGEVKKQGTMRPVNVDIPIAAIVPDILERIRKEIEGLERHQAVEKLRRDLRLGPGGALRELGMFLVEKAGVGAKALQVPLVEAIVDSVNNAYDVSGKRNDQAAAVTRATSQMEREAEEARELRDIVIQEMRSRVRDLERELPSARLEG
jgi:double-GTPase-like protein